MSRIRLIVFNMKLEHLSIGVDLAIRIVELARIKKEMYVPLVNQLILGFWMLQQKNVTVCWDMLIQEYLYVILVVLSSQDATIANHLSYAKHVFQVLL